MRLTAVIREALRTAAPDGPALTLPGPLPPRLYRQVDAALRAAGGRWDKGRQAHVFPGPARAALDALLARDEVVTEADHKKDTQFFPTPAAVVGEVIGLAGLGPDHLVLEPSAGDGAIAAAAAPLAAAVDCIELDSRRAEGLRRAGIFRQVRCRDFLATAPGRYDRVLMNPPFTRGADVRHVRHALRFVRPGGRLIAVMPRNILDRADKAARALRALMDEHGGWFEDTEARAFAAAGTLIDTVIAVIQVPPGRPAPPGEPARVTTDGTAWRDPLFHAATARPGVYVRYDPWHGSDRVFRFAGTCIGCGARTWAHDDGEDDVRGPFAGSTCVALTREDFPDTAAVPPGARFPRCAACWDDAARRCRALDRALRTALAQAGAGHPRTAAERELPAGPDGQLALFA